MHFSLRLAFRISYVYYIEYHGNKQQIEQLEQDSADHLNHDDFNLFLGLFISRNFPINFPITKSLLKIKTLPTLNNVLTIQTI